MLNSETVIVAGGEHFETDGKGWKVIHQDDSLASHTYGGMWSAQGSLLSAEADIIDAVAKTTVAVPCAGDYRVWSKYQAPPYFNYLHQIEVWQNDSKRYCHVYGRTGADRLWSFGIASNELFWAWGMDHDCAEAPGECAALEAGTAEIRVTSLRNPDPAGARMIDFIVLTTEQSDTYLGYSPCTVSSPFTNEAFAATNLYLRFHNATAETAALEVLRRGHFQPNYEDADTTLPPAAPGEWSAWYNIGPFIRWVHAEGLWMELPGADTIRLDFARHADGTGKLAELQIDNGDAVIVPMDLLWNAERQIRRGKDHAAQVIAASRNWRKANNGRKPESILFFSRTDMNYDQAYSDEKWVTDLKDTLGFNTQLPDSYDHVAMDGYCHEAHNQDEIRELAARLGEARHSLRVLSFGDEIHFQKIDYDCADNINAFRLWLKEEGVGEDELRVPVDEAVLTDIEPRLAWFTRRFSAVANFRQYREMTVLAKELIGEQLLTGANFSPHEPAPAYFGPVYQWIDAFKHNAMNMFWTEDYIFSTMDVPQIISWQFAQIRCAVKYNKQPIHYYLMTHSPGQQPSVFRRNGLMAVGSGAQHIDNFWVTPAENFTENYIAWPYLEQFQAVHELIYDTAEAEVCLKEAKTRQAQVAVLIGKATDENETNTLVPKEKDAFIKRCRNAPATITQQLCRRESSLLHLALRHAGVQVDVITEDDVIELNGLDGYKAVYFAGEWVNTRTSAKVEQWVEAGGVFYATAGLGHRNQYDERESSLLKLLGLESVTTEKDNYVLRTLAELVLAEPIDTIRGSTLGDDDISAIGMRQILTPADAETVATWQRGHGAAVTVRKLGRGKLFAVGTLPAHGYMKTGLRRVPATRGGKRQEFHPTEFAKAEANLVRLGVDAAGIDREVTVSEPHVEGLLLDNDKGTCLTLVNWTNAPKKKIEVQVKSGFKPAIVRSVQQQKNLDFNYDNGRVTFTTKLPDADYVLLLKN